MRAAFISSLIDAAKESEDIFLLVGDVGYNLVEPYIREFPDRFINIGIAEQNMTGIAAGLALSGKTVFCYSIANFPTLRCLEQIRNDVCYHNTSVKIVAGGGGLVYGSLGATHHVTEDLAIMRALPNMTVIAPGDPIEASLITRELTKRSGPAYLRLGRTGDPLVHQKEPEIKIGRAIRLREGNDVTLIACGGMLANTYKAAEKLAGLGIDSRVLSMHTVKPLDKESILTAASETDALVTVEEHSIIGGLGSAVAEVLAESGNPPVAFKRIALEDKFCSQAGSQDYLRKISSLATEDIVATVKVLLEGR